VGLTPWGSFEGWSALVRSAVVWCKMPDPGKTREGLRRRSRPEESALPAFLAGLTRLDPKGIGFTAASVIRDCELHQHDPGVVALRDAMAELFQRVNPKTGLPIPNSLGNKFNHLCGRNLGGMVLEKVESCNHAVGNRCKVVKAG
jgi:hypothetical protein